MRGMRACATANAVFLGLLTATLGFAACSSGSTPAQPPPGPSSATVTEAPPTAAPAPTATPPKARPAPQTVADCKVILSEITNDPPEGGVVLNNAMTAKDAGAGDRFEPLTDLIKSKRDGFRCCFDVWAKDHPGANGAARLDIKLKPDGSVISVGFSETPGRVPEVESCIGELAKGLTYPKSPSGKETTFHYPFDFKAHH
jgi:hypothetical protein